MSSSADAHADVLPVIAQNHLPPTPVKLATPDEAEVDRRVLELARELDERCGPDLARMPYRALMAQWDQLNRFFGYQPGSGESLYVFDRMRALRPAVEAKQDVLTRFNEVIKRNEPGELSREQMQELEISLRTRADNLTRMGELVASTSDSERRSSERQTVELSA